MKKQSLEGHVGEINIKKQPHPTVDNKKGPVPAASAKMDNEGQEPNEEQEDDESLSSRSSSFRSSGSETTEEISLKD